MTGEYFVTGQKQEQVWAALYYPRLLYALMVWKPEDGKKCYIHETGKECKMRGLAKWLFNFFCRHWQNETRWNKGCLTHKGNLEWRGATNGRTSNWHCLHASEVKLQRYVKTLPGILCTCSPTLPSLILHSLYIHNEVSSAAIDLSWQVIKCLSNEENWFILITGSHSALHILIQNIHSCGINRKTLDHNSSDVWKYRKIWNSDLVIFKLTLTCGWMAVFISSVSR